MSDVITQGLVITGIGFGIVFFVQATISLVVALFCRLDVRWKEREERHGEDRLAREPSIDDTTVVIITATVATYMVGRFRIRSVRRLTPWDGVTRVWSLQGRALLQGNHVIVKQR